MELWRTARHGWRRHPQQPADADQYQMDARAKSPVHGVLHSRPGTGDLRRDRQDRVTRATGDRGIKTREVGEDPDTGSGSHGMGRDREGSGADPGRDGEAVRHRRDGGHTTVEEDPHPTREPRTAQGHDARDRRAASDLVLEPEIGEFGYDDFVRAPELIKAGEMAARAALPQIRSWLPSMATQEPATPAATTIPAPVPATVK